MVRVQSWTAVSCLLVSAVFVGAGCEGQIQSPAGAGDETLASELRCGNPHHLDPIHFGHHHRRHHHPGSGVGTTGSGGTTGGAGSMGTGGTTGAAGSMAMGGTTGTAGTTGAAGSGGPGPCDPPDGIISWWHADGDFDDAVGSNDGINAGGVTFAPGEQLEGFSLDGGPTSYVTVADSSSLDITGPFTIDAWVNLAGGAGRIVDKITAGSSNGYLLDLPGGPLRLLVAGDSVTTTDPLPTGTFVHVAGVYDGTSLSLYVNGALAATKPTSVTATPTSTEPLHIGADSTGGSLFRGIIDEPRIFGRALSAAEIATIYGQGSICQ